MESMASRAPRYGPRDPNSLCWHIAGPSRRISFREPYTVRPPTGRIVAVLEIDGPEVASSTRVGHNHLALRSLN